MHIFKELIEIGTGAKAPAWSKGMLFAFISFSMSFVFMMLSLVLRIA